MKTKHSVLFLIIPLFMLLSSCVFDETKHTFKSNNNTSTEITQINLDKESVCVIGSAGVSTVTVNASVYPIYSTEKSIKWSVKNTNIAEIDEEKTTDSTVVVKMKDVGTTYLIAESKSGAVKAQCLLNFELETKAPPAVSELSAVAGSNNVLFNWTDPNDGDNDITHILVSAYKGTELVSETKFELGWGYGWISNLTPSTEYKFEFGTVDVNNNVSAKKNITVTTNAYTERTVKNVEFDSIEMQGDSAIINWYSSETREVKGVKIRAYTENDSALVPKEHIYLASVRQAEVKGLSANVDYTFRIIALDEDFNESEEIYVDGRTINSATNVAISLPRASGAAIVTWDDPELDFDSLQVIAKEVGEVADPDTQTFNVGKGVQKLIFSELKAGVKYNFIIKTIKDDVETAKTTAKSAVTRKIIWKLFNAYSNGSAQVVTNKTDTLTYANVVAPVKSVAEYHYPNWLYCLSLEDPTDDTHFSLMATNDAGETSGLYLCIWDGSPFPYEGYNSGMSCSGLYNSAYAKSKSEIIADAPETPGFSKNPYGLSSASFTLISSGCSETKASGTSDWYGLQACSQLDFPYYLHTSGLCCHGNGSFPATNKDYAYCYVEIEE